jgi:hypothetical protein
MTGYKSKKAAARDKLVQDAFNDWWGSHYDDSTNPCIEGTPVYWAWAGWHAALAQPEQEPVATVQCIHGITIGYLEIMQPVGTKLYTTPPQRKPLTDEDLDLICEKALFCRISFQQFARSIEAAHGIKEKNT